MKSKHHLTSPEAVLRKLPTWALWLFAAVFALGWLLLATAPKAHGYCAEWGERPMVNRYWPYDVRVESYCVRRYGEYRHRRPRVYGYERRDDYRDEPRRDETPRGRCLNEYPPISVTGDDKLTEKDAEISAQDRWSIEVETKRGTRFSDIRYAAGMTAACVRKVPTSSTERGQAALGIRHYICTIEATPCTSPKERIDDETRAKRRSEKVQESAPAVRIERFGK